MHPGILLVERRQNLDSVKRADCAKPQMAGLQLLVADEDLARLLFFIEEAMGHLLQRMTDLGKDHSGRRADKKFEAELCFQIADLSRQRWLTDI
jgi:hypothetical protein